MIEIHFMHWQDCINGTIRLVGGSTTIERDEWRCVWAVAGAQCVVSIIKKSPGLSALNLDFHQLVCTLSSVFLIIIIVIIFDNYMSWVLRENLILCIVIGAEVLRNGTTTEGTPVYSCTLTTSSTLSCTPTVNINCDHSMDLGVVCKTHQNVIGLIINRTIDQTLQTCPEQTTTCGTNQPTTTSEVDQSVLANEMVGSCPIASLHGRSDWSSGGCARGTCYWIDCNLLCVVEPQVTETASWVSSLSVCVSLSVLQLCSWMAFWLLSNVQMQVFSSARTLNNLTKTEQPSGQCEHGIKQCLQLQWTHLWTSYQWQWTRLHCGILTS